MISADSDAASVVGVGEAVIDTNGLAETAASWAQDKNENQPAHTPGEGPMSAFPNTHRSSLLYRRVFSTARVTASLRAPKPFASCRRSCFQHFRTSPERASRITLTLGSLPWALLVPFSSILERQELTENQQLDMREIRPSCVRLTPQL